MEANHPDRLKDFPPTRKRILPIMRGHREPRGVRTDGDGTSQKQGRGPHMGMLRTIPVGYGT